MLEKNRCVCENVKIEDYLKLYNYVRDNMEHPEWLGTFTREEIVNILDNGGKIWLYYDNDNLVCSMLYITISNESLIKHNVYYDCSVVGALGPIMVSPQYVGNGYQSAMMDVLEEYCKKINKKYIYAKVAEDNIYSLNNMLKSNYKIVDRYINERGKNIALLKEIKM